MSLEAASRKGGQGRRAKNFGLFNHGGAFVQKTHDIGDGLMLKQLEEDRLSLCGVALEHVDQQPVIE